MANKNFRIDKGLEVGPNSSGIGTIVTTSGQSSAGIASVGINTTILGGQFQVGTALTVSDSNVNVRGSVTASSFSGSGSGLTNLPEVTTLSQYLTAPGANFRSGTPYTVASGNLGSANVVLNKGTTTSPSLLFYSGNNINYGIRVNSSGNLEIGYSLGEGTESTNRVTISSAGNVVVAGTLNGHSLPGGSGGTYALVSQIPAAYTLPTASTSVLGGVKVDGTSITINGSGVISAIAAASSQVVVSTETADTQTYILFSPSNAGAQDVKVNNSLTFNSNTGTLSATSLNASTGSFSSNVTISGTLNTLTIPSGPGTLAKTSDITSYTLPTATASVLGGIKIGSGLSIDGSGVVSTTSSVPTQINLTAGSTGTRYILFGDSDTGNQTIRTDTNLFYNPGTNTLTAGTFSGTLSGAVTASTGSFSSNVTITGTLNGHNLPSGSGGTYALTSNITSYTLPTATASVLGGIKIGSGLSIDGSGVVSTTSSVPTQVSVVAAGTDTSTYVLLGTTAATGTNTVAADTGLTYNANSNALTTTTFVGDLNGNADSSTLASIQEDSTTTGSFYLPIITSNVSGNRQLRVNTNGSGLLYTKSTNTINANVTGNSGSATLVSTSQDASTTGTFYIPIVNTNAAGSQQLKINTAGFNALSFDKATSTILCNITGSANSATNVTGTGVVDSAQLAALSVIEAKIAAGAVTEAKLDGTNGSEAVTTAKIRSGAVTNAKITSMDSAKLTGTIDVANRVAAGAIDGGKITDNSITNGKITNPLNGARTWNGDQTWASASNFFTSLTGSANTNLRQMRLEANTNKIITSTITSSRRFKQNIEDLIFDDDLISKVLSLRPVSFEYKPEHRSDDDPIIQKTGLIAEEVEGLGLKDLITYGYTENDYDKSTDDIGNQILTLKEGAEKVPINVEYDKLTTYLLGLLQKQQQQIEDLTNRINNLEN